MAITDPPLPWQGAQVPGGPHTPDALGKNYNLVNQGDVDDEIERELQDKKLFQRSASVKWVSNPLWSLASAAFAFSVILCIALVVVLSKITVPGIAPSGEGGYYDQNSLSTHDCSRIQSIGASDFLTSMMLDYSSDGSKNGSASNFEQTFTIDIKSRPSLTFIQVKVIDVMWNLFAGQGVRFIMGYVTYRICSKALLLLMKKWRVSYGFYVSVGLQGTSLMSIFQAAKELLFQPSRRSLRDWLIVIWIIIGMVYTLSVPSLLSAATGYMVPTQSWWRMPDDVLVSNLTTATQACWFVGDGSRVGLSDNTSISGPSFLPFFGSLSPITEGGNPNNYCATLKTEFPVFDSLTQYYCGLNDLISTVSHNATAYRNSSTTITLNNTKIDIPAPPLDLIGHQPTSFYNESDFPSIKQCYRNQTIDFWDNIPPMVCVSGAEKYSWGFSKNLSYGILVAQGVWCLSTWFIWLYVTKICHNMLRETPGPFQATLALGDAMRADLGENAYEYSEKKLAEELGKRQGISHLHVRDSFKYRLRKR